MVEEKEIAKRETKRKEEEETPQKEEAMPLRVEVQKEDLDPLNIAKD